MNDAKQINKFTYKTKMRFEDVWVLKTVINLNDRMIHFLEIYFLLLG